MNIGVRCGSERANRRVIAMHRTKLFTVGLSIAIFFISFGVVNAPAQSTSSGSSEYNVRDYGAVGNGASDDSPAIQSAINAARTAGGGRVHVPPGTYLIQSTLRVTGNNIRFAGDGAASMILCGGNLQRYMFEIVGPARDVDVSQLFFIGRGGGPSHPAGVHAAAGTSRIQVNHCRFYNLGDYGGVDFSSSQAGTIHGNFSLNCWKGISVSGTVPDHAIIVSSNVIQDCNVGIALEFGRNIVVTGNTIEYTKNSGNFGIQVIGTTDVNVSNNSIYAPGNSIGNGIAFGPENINYGNAKRPKVTGNSVTGFAYGIRAQTVTDGIIASNTVKGQSLFGIALERSNTGNPSARNIVSSNVVDVVTSAVGIGETAGGGDNNTIENNRITNSSKPVVLSGTNSKARGNTGFTTENAGEAIIASGATSVIVSHGLAEPPTLKDISVTATNSLGKASKYWISDATPTTFVINVNTTPGATATFVWSAATR